MYLVLLAFGVVLAVAGFALGVSGISIRERVFDTSVMTPGLIAAAGGLILVGLGLALRVLQRIELTLAARPMPRAIRPSEVTTTAEGTAELPRIPFPPKAEIRPQGAAPAASAATPPAETKGPQALPLQLESVSVVQEGEVSLLPRTQARIDDAIGQLNSGRTGNQGNGNAAAGVAPRLDSGPLPKASPERLKGQLFDALWPKVPRPPRAEPVPAPAAGPEQNDAPARDTAFVPAQQEAAAPAVSVLKSGVVDGMAYTLYSDGSIEAQLPQGTLRFGSITELRSHIEQSPPDAASS